MSEKIKICWTSQHCCIRVIKQAWALIKTGRYDIHGVANQISWGTEKLDRLSFYHNKNQFRSLIKNIEADIYIHANEPNWQLNEIRRLKPNAKIILDAHDLDSIRQNIIPVDEHQAITNCDGIIFVSSEVKEFIHNLHRDQLKYKPTIILEHYCNEEFINIKQPPIAQRHGLVYQGGLQSPPYKDKMFQYRHLYPVMKQLVNQGHELHLMPGNIDATRTYADIGAFVYQPELYHKMMQKLLNKKWGLVIFNNSKLDQKQVNLTLTNKHYEYLACGLPIIVYGAPATAKRVKEQNVGLVFDKLEDITPEVLDKNYDRLKQNVDRIRPELTMEKHIHRLESLINKLLNLEAVQKIGN